MNSLGTLYTESRNLLVDNLLAEAAQGRLFLVEPGDRYQQKQASVGKKNIQGENRMTWREVKQAVEEAGVLEDEEIEMIQCENGKGDHTFHKVRLGQMLKLVENVSEEKARQAANGCAV